MDDKEKLAKYRELNKLPKHDLARKVASHPGHLYPPLNEVSRWRKDELISSYMELEYGAS